MLVMIPALLLLSHVANHTAIYVSPPLYGGDKDDHTIRCGGIDLEVSITYDGFWTRAGGRGWERVGAPADGYNLEALAVRARDFHREYPHERTVFFSAEPEVDYKTLIAAMDTVRGPECRLRDALMSDEPPENCMLFHPLIRPRIPNRHIPAFRGGQTWPPRPRRAVTPERRERSR